MGWFYSKY